jgi:hypothetical protein
MQKNVFCGTHFFCTLVTLNNSRSCAHVLAITKCFAITILVMPSCHQKVTQVYKSIAWEYVSINKHILILQKGRRAS